MRLLVAIIGCAVSAGLLAVSAIFNFQFGLTLGRTDVNSWAYGVASVSGDGLKALIPFAIGWAWSERRYLVAMSGAVLFVIATLYSLTSAFGFAAQDRAATAGAASELSSRYGDLSAERERLMGERKALGRVETPAAIKAAMAALRQDKIWSRTSQCTDATIPASRRFCQAFFAKKAALGTAQRAERIDHRLGVVRQELAALPASAAAGAGDAQVEALSSLLATTGEAAKLGLVILLALFVEAGSGMGFYVSMSHLKSRPKEAAPEPEAEPAPIKATPPVAMDDAAWLAERIVPAEGSSALTEIFEDYVAWCRIKGRRDASPPVELAHFLTDQGFRWERLAGRVTFSGLRLRRPSDINVIGFVRRADRA